MKTFGIISYNIHCNFTNYGSALQSWALYQTINSINTHKYSAKLIDYCPDCLKNMNPLNPIENMWDTDENLRNLCKLSLPQIKENYLKFTKFYNNNFNKTKKTYTSENFNDVIQDESIDGFICGSDTIFCIDEFGFDNGYYANFDSMKNNSISYAASFGDAHFDSHNLSILIEKIKNFKAIGLRENTLIPYLHKHSNITIKRVLDPTLLLQPSDYDIITAPHQNNFNYILLYSRRHNEVMTTYAEDLSQQTGCKIIEISLNALNANKHKMAYDSGVEEFLSLVKNASYVITNSYHGMIFSIQFSKPFVIFTREQCDKKINELLDLLNLSAQTVNGAKSFLKDVNYDSVHNILKQERLKSFEYLKQSLELL